jgi:hypothetical protein
MNIVKDFISISCKQDWDRIFEEEVWIYRMKEDVFEKHYAMVDRDSWQKIRWGIHLIQIELSQAIECENLLPKESNF